MCVGLLPLACASTPKPVDSVTANVAGVDMALAVQIAAAQCTANARHLEQFSTTRSEALYDECVAALIPARDALVLLKPLSSPSILGCTSKAVRVGLERVSAAFTRYGYATPEAIAVGTSIARRFEVYANDRCNPKDPTGTTTVTVDPNIARVEP